MLRPDEKATNELIEREKKSEQNLKSGLKTAGQIGVASAGLSGFNRIAPFLSEYLTEDMAYKGISKVAPKLGSVLSSGMDNGLSLKSGLDFLKQNMSKPKPENNPSKQNILDQYSTELREFIENKINKGFGHQSAAIMAQDKKEFKDVIDKIKKDHKLEKNFGFSDFIKSLYDTGLAEGESKAALQETESMQPQQGGQGQQALMEIINKIKQRMGA